MDDKDKGGSRKRDRRSADSGLGAEETSPARRVRPRASEGVVVPPSVPEEPEPELPQEEESEGDRVARLVSTYREQERYGSDEEEEERRQRVPRPPRVQADPRQALLDPEELREQVEQLEIPEGQEAAAGQGAEDVTFASASSSSSSSAASVIGRMGDFDMAGFMAGIGGAINNAAQAGAAAAIAAAPAPAPHAGGAQLNAVPIYNPDDKTVTSLTAKEWIRRVERLGQNFGWNNALLAGSAKNKLGGSAATWLESQVVRGELMNTWLGNDGFKNLFLQRFDKARGAVAAVEAISNLQQKESQSIRSFYDDVAIAVDLKHYNIDDADKQDDNYRIMRDNDIFILFQCGMKKRVKELAMAGSDPPTTAADLLEAAVRIETTLKDSKTTHKVGEVKHETNGEAGSSDEDEAAGSPEEQIAALKRKLKRFKDKGKGKMKCFEKDCQSPDHQVANCPVRKAKIEARNRGRGAGDGHGGRGSWQGQGRGGWNGGGGWRGSWSPYPRGYGYGPPRRFRGMRPRGPRGGGRGRGGYAYEIEEHGYDYSGGYEYPGEEPYEEMTEEVAATGYGYDDYGGNGYSGEALYSGND